MFFMSFYLYEKDSLAQVMPLCVDLDVIPAELVAINFPKRVTNYFGDFMIILNVNPIFR